MKVIIAKLRLSAISRLNNNLNWYYNQLNIVQRLIVNKSRAWIFVCYKGGNFSPRNSDPRTLAQNASGFSHKNNSLCVTRMAKFGTRKINYLDVPISHVYHRTHLHNQSPSRKNICQWKISTIRLTLRRNIRNIDVANRCKNIEHPRRTKWASGLSRMFYIESNSNESGFVKCTPKYVNTVDSHNRHDMRSSNRQQNIRWLC